METLTVETIRTLTYGFLIITVLWYFLRALRHRTTATYGRVDTFLRYRSTATTGAPITSSLLKATLMASAFSLASAIYVYVDWASFDGMFVLWSPITWAAGALIFYFLRVRIFNASRETWTLHSFLQKRYDSVSLMRVTSLITSLFFLLQVAAEVYIGLAILQVLVGSLLPAWVLAILLGIIFIGYSLIGGLPSVLLTDRGQYRLIAFAILLATFVLIDDGGGTAVTTIIESFSTTFQPVGGGWIILFSLLALNLPLFVTDMSVWQRVGAAESIHEVTRGLRKFVPELLGWMSLLVCIGVGFSVLFEPASGMTYAQGMLSYFADSMVFPFLMAGFVAALLSTGDTFLLASVQTLLVDWKYARPLSQVQYDADQLSPSVHRKMLHSAQIGVVIAGFGSVILGYLLFQALPSVLDLFFVLFGLQTALTPTVVWALFNKGTGNARAAIVSVLAGGATAFMCLIMALGGYELLGVSLGLWAPIFALCVSILIYVIFLFFCRTQRVTANQ